jgi:mRNA-degrading endonuclease toxin of MazEF toxin-antitoxin module
MKPFDVFSWQPPGWVEPHPCVIVSHPARIANKAEVNVVACSSKRATRKAQAHEVILDQADGLDWPTLCKCDLLYSVSKSELKHRRGEISPARRKVLVRTIIGSLGWGEVLSEP